MIAYKGTKNLKCKNQVYEVGKTYSMPRKNVRMCESGFHFCEKLKDINFYYELCDIKTIIVEIEVDENDIIEKQVDKLVASKIKILRIVPKEEYSKLTDGKFKFENNVFTYKELDKIIVYKYNKRCNRTKCKHSTGYWEKYKYDKNNNKIKTTDSNGCRGKYKYDKNNNLTKFKDSNGYWEKYKYDKMGNKVKKKDSNGYWAKCKYDEMGNKLTFESSSGYWAKCKYDEMGNKLTFESSSGYWAKRKYDTKNNMIEYEDRWGVTKYEYDEYGGKTITEEDRKL